jgi:hypothetical protein
MSASAIRFMISNCDYADGIFPDKQIGPFLPISEAEVEIFKIRRMVRIPSVEMDLRRKSRPLLSIGLQI